MGWRWGAFGATGSRENNSARPSVRLPVMMWGQVRLSAHQYGQPQYRPQAQGPEIDPAPDLGQVQVRGGAWRRPVATSQRR